MSAITSCPRPASLGKLLRDIAAAGRTEKQLIGMTIDALVASLALWLAYLVRYGGNVVAFEDAWYLYLLMPPVTVMLFGALGIYHWVIRSSNNLLIERIAIGATASACGLLALMYLFPPGGGANVRSLFVIYGTFLIIGTSGLRLVWQSSFGTAHSGEPIAIYGAGAAGQQLAALVSQRDDKRPVLFIDDDPALLGRCIGGVPVVSGNDRSLGRRLHRSEARRVIFAMPSVSRGVYLERLERIERIGLPVQTLPPIAELDAASVRAEDVRNVSISDILGRAEVPPDPVLLARRVRGQVVLVTGGGGSIGSELCRQIYRLGPRTLVVLDQSEENLYHVVESLDEIAAARGGGTPPVRAVLGSVTDQATIEDLLREEHVDTIYHAAAYKHVPIVEAQPERGVEVNVFGTLNVVEHAIRHGVAHFVLVSTDKAVRPTNAMGASKRLAEMILQARAREQSITRFSMVRFGNVLDSSGSVVPKFRRQIEMGGPVTLTSRKMTRFFMTIPEAAQLVLQASAIAEGGEVFVLDMGEPVRIEALAQTMIELYGPLAGDRPGAKEIEIVEIGTRPGEKLYEELFIDGAHRRTEVAKIFTANECFESWETVSRTLGAIRSHCGRYNRERLLSLLLEATDGGVAGGVDTGRGDAAAAVGGALSGAGIAPARPISEPVAARTRVAETELARG